MHHEAMRASIPHASGEIARSDRHAIGKSIA
jgi:hypothetical protein